MTEVITCCGSGFINGTHAMQWVSCSRCGTGYIWIGGKWQRASR